MTNALDDLLADAGSTEKRRRLLETLGCRDLDIALVSLQTLLDLGIVSELVVVCLRQLTTILPTSPNADRGLTNLVSYIAASRSPQALLALFERDQAALPTLMHILATSQSWSEQLITDPESFDLLRMTEGLPVSRSILVDELATEVSGLLDPQMAARSLHTFKQRETMRIAFGDFIGALPIETVAQQLSTLAEAIIETAIRLAQREVASRFGVPPAANGQPARMSVIGYGDLGGNELSYAPRLDLMMICDPVDAPPGGRGTPLADYFERVGKRAVQLITDNTYVSSQYVVHCDLRAMISRDTHVAPIDAARRYYENQGQTWQRLSFIKARHVAGDAALSHAFLSQLEPWVFRRYLSRSDITEIAALKRQLGKRVHDAGQEQSNVHNRAGGVRDIQFLIQYLQLLNGGELPEVRLGNTLDAIGALERTGCLTAQERSVLDDNYRFLRKVEHRLQVVLGHDTETLPTTDPDRRQFLIATGFVASDGAADTSVLTQQLDERTKRNSRILDHLLSETFTVESGEVAPETDLILEQSPPAAEIVRLLSPYKFSDVHAAYREFIALGQEQVSFLSSRRCRHFLAAIAPRLLQSFAKTPSPDVALSTLRRVSDSLGGKAVLWELFQSSQPAMELCIRLCATSPYLIAILTSNPGMIDELIDSLMLDRLPTTQHIESLLAELCRGVDDPGLVLHSFKNSMHLHIGARDVLGKDEIVDTHRALSDVAEACLKQTIEHEFHRLIQKLGVPIVAAGPRVGEAAEMVVLAVGKLGGREPNYHSDLDVLFLYEGDGTTRPLLPHRRHDSIANRLFFNQLAQRVVKSITRVGPAGHLYELDARLRPLGGSVGLCTTLDDLEKYFCCGPAQLWERQALCKARPVWASPAILPRVAESVRAMLTSLDWQPEHATDIQRHRVRLEQGAAPTNIKRGYGGTLDIEFIVQMLQLKHARAEPDVLVPGTLDALAKLLQFGFLNQDQGRKLSANYRWLRRVESGLRLMNLAARHELPTANDLLDQLQFLLQTTRHADWSIDIQADNNSHPLGSTCTAIRQQNRQIFKSVFASS
ncbi:MAG: hypothetical protein IT423_06665 [Pirellulaceae bacterium]|nr:hypothetical protein [Pirellulaceae bacterium]